MTFRSFVTRALFLVCLAGSAEAACIQSAPNGSSLPIVSKPDASAPLMGGVRVGSCDVEVTRQCSTGFCQVFVGSLSGWADMRHITIAKDEKRLERLVYRVVGGEGSVTMAGMTQPTHIERRGQLIFTPKSTTMQLTLPKAFAHGPVAMQRIGSGSFSGKMTHWATFPVPVSVIVERLGGTRTTLDFAIRSDKVTMNMQLVLKRVGTPHLTTTLTAKSAPSTEPDTKEPGGETITTKPSLSPATPPAPQTLPQPASSSASLPKQACAHLSATIGRILRTASGPTKRAGLMAILRKHGMADINTANAAQCNAINRDLEAAGL